MRRATITIGDELESALASYQQDRHARPALTAVVQAALREYLARRGYLTSSQGVLSITPADHGSGKTDVSPDHDRYFADL